MSLNVVPENLPAIWWRIPVLILDAAQNGILEEVLVLGYLLRRLDQLGWAPGKAIALAAVVRGSYHLYQGFGGFIGNAILGVIFGVLVLRLWTLQVVEGKTYAAAVTRNQVRVVSVPAPRGAIVDRRRNLAPVHFEQTWLSHFLCSLLILARASDGPFPGPSRASSRSRACRAAFCPWRPPAAI